MSVAISIDFSIDSDSRNQIFEDVSHAGKSCLSTGCQQQRWLLPKVSFGAFEEAQFSKTGLILCFARAQNLGGNELACALSF